MTPLLAAAIVCMTLALVFYTTGVFAERKAGTLFRWHAAVFWTGFIFDTTGTTIMGKIAGAGFSVSVHSITGVAALLLMAFHALWATVILVKGSEKAKKNFHRFSIIVWAIWLVPYIAGLYIGMAG